MQKTRNTRITNEAMGIIANPGLHVAKGLHAFAKGDYSVAWLHMNACRADLQSIGGSHAQRDIFERITIESALRGGYLQAAESLLLDRTNHRNGTHDGYATARMSLIEAARQQVV